MSTDPQGGAVPSGHPGAIRLTVAYDDAGVRVIDRTPVDKPVPPGVEEPRSFRAGAAADGPQLPAHAVVTELRTAGDDTTYRQVVEHAIPHDQEVFDPSVERGVRRHAVPPPSGVFTVIVPDDPAAEAVVLLAHPGSTGAERALTREAARQATGPVELARFPLRAGGGDGIG
jgi:hypothetical protein